METRYQWKYTVSPKISYFNRVINGKEKRIKLVRDSLICQLTNCRETVIIGNTIFARKRIVSRKVFNRALERMAVRNKMGTIRYIWKCLTERFG